MTLADWLDSYARAWEERDPEAAARLFSEDAVYRSHRFGGPSLGQAGVEAYWRTATEPQENVQVRFGKPLAEGERAAVEWWTTLGTGDEERTVAGCLFLRFDPAGLCEELRECWHTADGLVEPPPGWGR
jgi:SnoaL-like domain